MTSPTLLPRIVLIEDDAGRIEVFSRWLEGTEFILVVARSGGQALGLLGKGSTAAIAGIALDHDLSDAALVESDQRLSGADAVPLIQHRVRRSTPILIHSHHSTRPAAMQRALESAGFSVERIRFDDLDESRFFAWLADVRDNWDPPAA